MVLGTGELIVIGFVLVVIFSASKMAALGNTIGRIFYALQRGKRGSQPPKGPA